jgi:hypothetical protein
MKLRLTILAVLLCGSALFATAATPVSNQYTKIVSAWNAPASTYPDCSATVTTYCLSTYTFTATSPTGSNAILTVANGGIPAGGAVSYTYAPGGYLYCGTWGISVTANFIDGSGAGVSSSPVAITLAVPCPLTPSPVTGLSATPAL